VLVVDSAFHRCGWYCKRLVVLSVMWLVFAGVGCVCISAFSGWGHFRLEFICSDVLLRECSESWWNLAYPYAVGSPDAGCAASSQVCGSVFPWFVGVLPSWTLASRTGAIGSSACALSAVLRAFSCLVVGWFCACGVLPVYVVTVTGLLRTGTLSLFPFTFFGCLSDSMVLLPRDGYFASLLPHLFNPDSCFFPRC